jgi:hypothetical protein
MKLVIVLLVMFTIATGEPCTLTKLKHKGSAFTGRINYPEEFNPLLIRESQRNLYRPLK